MASLGDRTMGIWEKMPEKFLAALDSRFGIVSPREHGVDTVDAIRAMRDGRANRSGVDQAEPQSRGPRRHCVDPAVTGPHRPRHPRWGETTGVGGRFDVHGSSVARQPAPAQRSGAQRGRHRLPAGPHPARPGHPVPWEQFAGGYDTIRDAIAAVVPGCDDYNRKVRAPDGFQLLHGPRDSREFPTSTGKANFSANPLGWVPVPEGRLVLQTLSSHDQYNTTIYGLDDRYRGVKGGRRVVLVNPADVERFGLSEGDRVDLVSEFTNSDGHMHERRAKDFMVVGYSTPVGNAAAYYLETKPLVPLDHTATRSNTPASKAIVIRLGRT
jgi:anaerobic selenocysteine-containing dehydrogenase